MADVVSIRLLLEDAQLAQRALAVTESMIKLEYIPKELPWAAEAEGVASLSKRYFRFGEEAAKLDPLPAHPFCSLKWLRREGAAVVLDRCADIQSPVDVFWPGDFFTQLCLTLSKCFPDACFTAFCRHEETVSATVQHNRITSHYGKLLYAEMWELDEDDFDEDDWSRAGFIVLRDTDGVFIQPPR